VFDTNIKHFPFSDHDLVSTKLKLDDIERGPGIWAMNFNTITSQNNIVMIDTIIFMVVRNVLKRIEKLFSITA
jgi:hypothetical protein